MGRFDDTLCNYDWLYDKYITKDKSLNQISKELGCSDTTVKKHITNHNIKLRQFKVDTDVDVVEKLLKDGKTLSYISQTLDRPKEDIQKIMMKYGLKRHHRLFLDDKEWLENEYKSHSLRQIAKKLKCSKPVVSDALKKHNIKPKSYNVNKEVKEVFTNKDWLKAEIQRKSLRELSKEYNCSQTWVFDKIKEYGFINEKSKPSIYEYEILRFLEVNNIKYIHSTKSIISPYELDIYIPSKNIAIEFNGLYWHSDKYKSFDYHKMKTELCEQQGIQLIHIFEDDWKYRKQQVKNLLLSKLGLINEKVFARKCQVITGKFPEFFENNHIQGDVANTVTYGLQYDGSLVAAMAFKIRSECVYELVRYATSIQVVGGASKLLKRFIKDFPNCKEIISFADRCISNGNMYYKLGFTLDKIIRPDYKYVIGDKKVHKFNYRIDRFKKDDNLLYEEGLTERQLADLNGLYRIYDAGKMRFVMKL